MGAECKSDSECHLGRCSCSTVGHGTGNCGPLPFGSNCHKDEDCQSAECVEENWPWEYCVGKCTACVGPYIIGDDGYCHPDPNPQPIISPPLPPLSNSAKYTGPCVGDQQNSCAIGQFACYDQEGFQGVIQCNDDVKYWDEVPACHRFCHLEPLP